MRLKTRGAYLLLVSSCFPGVANAAIYSSGISALSVCAAVPLI